MKPFIHAQSSVRKFGGLVEDYLKIHDWFDQTKSHFGDNRHRAILHSSFGIFLAEQVFGHNITNSKGKQVSVRDIGEQHVVEDLGFIPNPSDYLSEMKHLDWMSGKGKPASQKELKPEHKDVRYDGSLPSYEYTAPSIGDFTGIKGLLTDYMVDGASPVKMPIQISD